MSKRRPPKSDSKGSKRDVAGAPADNNDKLVVAPVFDPKYFEHQYGSLRLNADGLGEQGLRRGQKGAIHSLAGHLCLKHDPALVVMPTGSGKTAVLMMLPFLERSKRALVVTPSVLVREQIATNFATLDVLCRTGVVPAVMPLPSVHELRHKVTSAKEWRALEKFNVVVTTPNALSPAQEGVAPPPDEFFDLLLIDEAHHSPAVTWQAILDAFPKAKRALFTATPFRRDRKEIKGTIVFSYPLSEAAKDGVFGQIKFEPILVGPDDDPDVEIARKVETALAADRKAGLAHSILVRADTKARADELLTKYQKHTKLKLWIVHSGHSVKRVRDTIRKLLSKELDGVVCVNMLGEGFDFPNLKIAGLHAPHRSLGVTLQFIGRFARTGDKTIGTARFFAVPAEIEGETARLFAEDAAWEHMVQNLAENRVEAERDLREQLASFDAPEITDEALEDLSLYAIRPARHVKVFEAPAGIDLAQNVSLPRPFEIVYRRHSPDNACVVIIAREQLRPKWSDQARFARVEYELVVVYWDKSAGLLFINSSRRTEALYRAIGEAYVGGPTSALPLHQINRCVAGLTEVECFSVGMRNRVHTSRTESYRMLAGPRANQAVKRSDGRLFHRGHLFCAGKENGEKTTLGYSSGSKFWSANGGHIPSLLRWCRGLAGKLSDERAVGRVPGLEPLSVGQTLTQVPADVIAVEWHHDVYSEEYTIAFKRPKGAATTMPLAQIGLRVDRKACTADTIRVVVEPDGLEWHLNYSPLKRPMFAVAKGQAIDATVATGDEEHSLVDFLNAHPLVAFTGTFGQFCGQSWFPASVSPEPIAKEQLHALAWTGVNIQREFGSADSIHEFVKARLLQVPNAVVFYDHRAGEIADFVVLDESSSRVTVTLYHCKGSGGASPGDRVDDLYEVCGQVVKSVKIVNDGPTLLKHIKRRAAGGSMFLAGDFARAEAMLTDRSVKPLHFCVVAVQPGASKAGLSGDRLAVLGAADDAIVDAGADRLVVWGSA